MKCFLRILAAACFLLAPFATAQTNPPVAGGAAAAPPPVAPILPGEFRGWTHAFRLENDLVSAVLVPDIGRLVSFSPRDGQSLFRLEESMQGRLPAAGENFFNIGGDWFWPVAQARWPALSADGRNWPPPDALADGAWACSAWTDADGAQCAMLTRAYGAPLNVLATRLFRLAPGSAALVVQQRLERTAASDIPVLLWNVSQIGRAEQIALPVEKQSKFRSGLKVLMGAPPKRRQLSRCSGAAVYRVAPGAEIKLGSDSPRGWIAAARGTNAVFECVLNSAGGDFPDGGCVVEVYSNEGLGYSEIETLSPELALAPGTVLENTLRIEPAPLATPPAGCDLAAAAHALAEK